MTSKVSDGAMFLIAFNKIKSLAGDDPGVLERDWEQNDRLVSLCDEVAKLVRGFEAIEDWSPIAFTPQIPAESMKARRDFEERWQGPVFYIADRESFRQFDELFGPDFLKDVIGKWDSEPVDELGATIDGLRSQGRADATAITSVIHYAQHRFDMDDDGDLDELEEGLIAWERLIRVSGLDLPGALWRRRAVPHILIPSHVSKHYGGGKLSLYRRLHEATCAFTFGAPLAALALQRAVLEQVLKNHWNADGGLLRNADFPVLSWGGRADRLKNLANDALHRDPDKLTGMALERAIIQNFQILQILIEQAPRSTSIGG